MNVESVDFRASNMLLREMSALLSKVDSEISDLLVDACPSGADMPFSTSAKLERLRFDRNKLRAEFLDLEYVQRRLKRRHFETQFMEILGMEDPEAFATISASAMAWATDGSAETQILAQERLQRYRKLEDSFKDRESMLHQKHMAEISNKEDLEWEARLEHALAKSKRYFARQCSRIKAIREEILALSLNEYCHQFYLEAVHQLGEERIADIASLISKNRAV